MIAPIVLALVVVTQGATSLPQTSPSNTPDKNVCLTEHCIAASSRLFKSMNLSADPCDDFNEFACGKFLKEFTLPEDKDKWSSSTEITETISERGRILLEEKAKEADWPVFNKAKDLYKGCMNLTKLEELGVEPAKTRLKAVGGWPVVEGDAWSEEGSGFKWYEKIFEMNKLGLGKDYIFQISVGTNDKNSSWRAIFLDQPSLGMPREYLIKGFEDKDVQHYYTYMKETAILFGANPDKAAAELKESLLFEIELAKISAPREERRNASKLYNPFVVGQFESLPGHPTSWTDYINGIILGANIGPDEIIIVNDPDYVKNVSKVLNATNPRVIANHLGWQATQSLMAYLNEAARNIKQKYLKARTGVDAPPPRWKTCVNAVGFNTASSASLKIPVGSLYVQRYFPSEAKAAMLDMIKYLRAAFVRILEELDWMDATTKERANKKLSEMIQFIAYPDEILNKTLVEKHHEGIEIKEDDFVGNVLRLTIWNQKFSFGRLREKVDKKYWIDHSTVALVNAFYSSSINSIEFPAGILQGVFFNHEVPKYLNYGAIGMVIGHEITHGFDDKGSQKDFEGNINNWWDDETKSKFLDKVKCIIDQYANYNSTQVGLKLNGVTTQGENIADNGGMKEAFSAYEQWVRDNGEEPLLPGHNFTQRQLFWISHGQVWCSKFRDASLESQIRTGQHSPGEFRIIGPLSNSVQFSKDFNCPAGSRMNPVSKCSVW